MLIVIFLGTDTRAGSNYKKSNQLQLLAFFQLNYNYTSKMCKSITIIQFQLHLYYAECNVCLVH